MVVTVGLAVTVVPVVALKPAAGVQVYVTAPVPVNGELVPVQILGEFTPTVGGGFTVTVAMALPVQPAIDVPVTV